MTASCKHRHQRPLAADSQRRRCATVKQTRASWPYLPPPLPPLPAPSPLAFAFALALASALGAAFGAAFCHSGPAPPHPPRHSSATQPRRPLNRNNQGHANLHPAAIARQPPHRDTNTVDSASQERGRDRLRLSCGSFRALARSNLFDKVCRTHLLHVFLGALFLGALELDLLHGCSGPIPPRATDAGARGDTA